MATELVNLDALVRLSIAEGFPGQTFPDENNRLPNGERFKAPDHSLLDGRILVERKSRLAVDRSQFHDKLQQIAAKQGVRFQGYGKNNLGKILSQLPEPQSANAEMIDYVMNQTMKSVREARKQFESYAVYNPQAAIRILIISDNSRIPASNATDEHFLGRKMGGYDSTKDETGIIDGIILVKHPEYVFDEDRSFWYKFLVKRRLGLEDRHVALKFAEWLHYKLATHRTVFPYLRRIRSGAYQPLIV